MAHCLDLIKPLIDLKLLQIMAILQVSLKTSIDCPPGLAVDPES